MFLILAPNLTVTVTDANPTHILPLLQTLRRMERELQAAKADATSKQEEARAALEASMADAEEVGLPLDQMGSEPIPRPSRSRIGAYCSYGISDNLRLRLRLRLRLSVQSAQSLSGEDAKTKS